MKINKNISNIKIILILLIFVISFPIVVCGQDNEEETGAPSLAVNVPEGLVGFEEGSTLTMELLIRNVIKGVMGILGSITLLMFVMGGLLWILSGGNAERVKKARDMIKWALLGIFIIFSSYMIITFIFGMLSGSGESVDIDQPGYACPCISGDGDNGPNCDNSQQPEPPIDGAFNCPDYSNSHTGNWECMVCIVDSPNQFIRGLCPGTNNTVCTIID